MQRGFGIISLLFGLLILIILITSAMSISVDQLKSQERGHQPYYKEKTEQVEEMYERNRRMQREQMKEYENDGAERENYEEEREQNPDEEMDRDSGSRKKHSRLKGKRGFAENNSKEVEVREGQEQSYEENHAQERDIDELSPEKKEQFLEIIEKDFRDSGNMVEMD